MSTKSSIPFFGQAWELVVGYSTPPKSDGTPGEPTYETISTDAWEPEALRITFEVQAATLSSPWWYADIAIYNLDTATIQRLIFNAAWVTLKAGFQTGPTTAGIIWDGPVLQVLYDQENVVDQRITLHCQANPLVMQDGVVSFALGQYSSQALLLSRAASQINLPDISADNGTLSDYAQDALSKKAYPRGNTIFGKVGSYLSTIADDQFLNTYRDGYRAYMTDLGQPGVTPPAPDFIFSPSNPPDSNLPVPPGTTPTIIGTPRQVPQGVAFTVLLDPRLKVRVPPMVVQLVRTLPSQLAIQPDLNANNLGTPLNSNLTFFLGQVRHVGDSRGNEWYTEVTGFSTTYAQNLLSGLFAPPAAGG